MGGSGITLMINGSERKIPTADVVVIDFVGNAKKLPDTEVAKLHAGQDLIVMRGDTNDTLSGNLYDIAGKDPVQIVFNTKNGERKVASTNIARIYLRKPAGSAVATTGTTPAVPATPANIPAGAIVIPANQQWTSTGLTVQEGDVVTFNTTGEIRLSNDTNDIAVSPGAKSGRRAANSPIPASPAGALIMRIGNRVYDLGDQTSVPMPTAGELFLGINDDVLNDNVGQFYVVVRNTGGGRRR